MVARGIYAIFLSLVILLGGCGDRHKTKEELLTNGIKLLQERRPSAAIVALKNALEKDQNYFEARLQLAKAYNALGNFAAAEKELEKVRRQNPSSREVKIEIARVMANTKRPENALRELAEFLGDAAVDCEALEIAGWAHAVNEDYPVAVTLLRKAAANCGAQSTSASLSLAIVYLKMGKAQEAEKQVGEVLTKEPENRKALYLLADIQMQRKDRAEALKTFDRIIKASPGDPDAQYRKGVLFIDSGEYDAALALSQSMTKNFSERPEGYRLQGIALFFKKQYNDAIAPLQKSLLEPNAGVYYLLGLTHYYRNEPQQAMNQLQKALDLQPSLTRARVQLALLLLNQRRADDAIKEAKKALAEEKDNAYAHNVLGSAYMLKGDSSEGMAELNKALALDPSLAEVHFKKGLAAMNRGRNEEAESELAAAVRVQPDAQDARRMLALYYMRQNQQAKAIEVLEKGMREGKPDAVSYELIGESLLQLNKTDEARANFIKAKEADPKYGAAYQRLAWIFFLQAKQDEAVRELRTLLDQSPENLPALLQLAFFHEINGDEKDARKTFLRAADTKKTEGVIAAALYFLRANDSEKALRIVNEGISGSRDAEISLYELKGKILLTGKKYKDALTAFETLERRNPQLGSAYIVNTYVAMGEQAKAIEKVRSDSKKDPTSLILRAELSRIYFLTGNKTEAAETAREIIRKTPGSAVGYIALAQVHQSSNEIDKAIEVLKSGSGTKDGKLAVMLAGLYGVKKNYAAALEQCRKAESGKAGSDQILFQKAAILESMGKKKDAEAEYEKILRSSPNNVMAMNNLACLYSEENANILQGFQYAAKAFMLAPGNDSVQETLGYLLVRNGRIGQGVKILRKVSESNPKNSTIYFHLGVAYHEGGESAKAAESLQKALSLGDFPEAHDAQALLDKIRKNGKS